MAARGRAGGRGGRGNRTAVLDEVYEQDDVAREARIEEGFAELKAMLGNIVQRMDALEIADPTRHRPVRPDPPIEDGFSDDEDIKPFGGGNYQVGRYRDVAARTRGSHYCEFSKKIEVPKKIGFPRFHGGRRKDVIEEILVEGDVGDFIDDILEEESDKIFLDTNPSLLQSEIDWDSPPKFDEYSDEEETVIHKVEENLKDEFVQIEKKFVTILDKVDGLDSIDGVLNVGKKAIKVCTSLGFKVSQFIDPFWEFIEDFASSKSCVSYLTMEIVPLIFEDFFLEFGFGKINLKYKMEADKVRRIQLYKLEDEFLQAEENDAG